MSLQLWMAFAMRTLRRGRHRAMMPVRLICQTWQIWFFVRFLIFIFIGFFAKQLQTSGDWKMFLQRTRTIHCPVDFTDIHKVCPYDLYDIFAHAKGPVATVGTYFMYVRLVYTVLNDICDLSEGSIYFQLTGGCDCFARTNGHCSRSEGK